MLDDLPAGQKVVLIQPRRVAARAAARRIAQLRGSPLGGEVGYQVRFDSCVSRETRLAVVTTGILLRRLLDDVSIDDVGAVVLDEFHERTIEMDLALGLLVRIRQTLRPDLRIVVMSATLAAEPVARLLGDCPIIHAEGRRFPVQVRYLRARRPAAAAGHGRRDRARGAAGNHRARARLLAGRGRDHACAGSDRARCRAARVRDAAAVRRPARREQQDLALTDRGRRKIILATNVAETSLTIEGVTAVIDSGLARQMQVSAATGLPRLELVPISQASAEQRAGRAGRTAPGVCWRLWTEANHRTRPAADTPEVLRATWPSRCCNCSRWASGTTFPGSTRRRRRPSTTRGSCSACSAPSMRTARRRSARRPPLGRELARLPTHPRLGRLLLAGAELGVLRETSIAAALLSERDPFRAVEHGRRGPTDYHAVRSRSDVVDRVFALQAFHAGTPLGDADLELHPGGARNVLQAAEQLFRVAEFPRAPRAEAPDVALMQALLAAFPDRLAKLRPGTQDRALMVGGRGVRLDASSRVRGEPLFLAIDLNDAGGEARARLASAVDRAWLPDRLARSQEEMFFNPTRGQVEARLRTYWVDLVLEETPVAISDAAPRPRCSPQQARQQLERWLPADDTAAGSLMARVRWLKRRHARSPVAGARPRRGRRDAAGVVPWFAIARGAAVGRLVLVGSQPRRVRPAGRNRPPGAGRAGAAQRQAARRWRTSPASRRCWRCGSRSCSAWPRRRAWPAGACRCCCTCWVRTSARSR